MNKKFFPHAKDVPPESRKQGKHPSFGAAISVCNKVTFIKPRKGLVVCRKCGNYHAAKK